jgi:ABC-type Zn2+ transport system substrate-binding protein/surface adhesin
MYKLKEQQQEGQNNPTGFKPELSKNIQASIQNSQKQSDLKQSEVYSSNFSRSQSRIKQTNKNIFNQFKNVVNAPTGLPMQKVQQHNQKVMG